MKQNMSSADRILRILIAAVFVWLYFSDTVTGIWGLVLLIVGAVFVVTSVAGFCPLYAALRIKTNKKPEIK